MTPPEREKGATTPTEMLVKIRYWCRECAATFTDGLSANQHHDATGHHQTWKPQSAFVGSLSASRERDAND